jgi:RNA polymerase sigma factor for flagellar operon FliA
MALNDAGEGSLEPRPKTDQVRELVHRELGLVEVVAKQIFRATRGLVELDELMSAGREGLFEAARRFDAAQGVPFRAYANYRVRGAIMDAMRKASWLPRRAQQRLQDLEAAGQLSEGAVSYVFTDIDNLSGERLTADLLDEHVAAVVTAMAATPELATEGESDVGTGGSSSNPEEAVGRGEMLALIRNALHELNDREASVIRLLFFEHRTLEETADALGMQKPWASRLQTRAMERLTKRLRQAV